MSTVVSVNIDEKSKYEWQPLVTVSKIPPIRINSQSHLYKDDLILFLGAGAGVGRSQEVWKFNLKTLNWKVIEPKGDIPPARDGHTVTYIGKGKFILFGGQGIPYENDKSEKITETIAIKTFLVRELYNSMYQLDIEAEHWIRFEEDGNSPMGRRGHTMNFLPPLSKKAKIALNNDNHSLSNSSQEHGSIHSYSRHKKHNHHHEDLSIPDNSLILYGGSGIESSKYTEYYFNDLWVFNLKSKSWTRQRTKGFKPRALFDHRSEIVGDYLVIVGGLTGREGKESSFFTDVLTLNIKTCTWNSIDLYDLRGKSTKLKLHGFSMTKNTKEDDNNANTLIIFGGRETVEAKRAQTEGAGRLSPRRRKQKPQPTVFKLDVERGQLIPFKTRNEAPINRYGHVGICSTDVDTLISNNGNVSRRKSVINPLEQIEQAEMETPLLYVFGGSATENGGFCDPIVYQLVKVREKINPIDSLDAVSINEDLNSRPSTGSNFSVGDSTHYSESHAMSPDDDENQLDSRLSIWEKTQFQQMRSQDLTVKLDPNTVRAPTTWSELKLALSYPLSAKQSLRQVHSPVDTKKKDDNNLIAGMYEEAERLKRTKLSAQKQRIIHLKSLSHKLVPLTRGRTVIAAKELYLKEFPLKFKDEFGQFFISNPNSISRKMTASNTVHHHGSKTLDPLA